VEPGKRAKAALAKWLAAMRYSARYITFDDATVLATARADPTGFIAGLKSYTLP